jgi:hypothetical protein
MELIKVTKKGSIHFKLDDGRLGVSYNSGYIRVSVKNSRIERMYQINKKITLRYGKLNDQYHYRRKLIPSSSDRVKALLEFNNNNCK